MKLLLASTALIAVTILSCLHLEDAIQFFADSYQEVAHFFSSNVQIPTN